MSRPSRLSSEQIRAIRESDKPLKQIADQYGISLSMAWRTRLTRNSSVGALWLCYHALKASEWTNVNDFSHPCPYCGNAWSIGHDKDCMIGNGLKAMEEATHI